MPNILRPQEFGDKRSKLKTAPQDIPQSYGLVVVKDDKILLVKPRGHDVWEIPKGALDGKEAPKKAAERETKEETGVTATASETLGFVIDDEWNDGEGKVVYAWLADYKSGMIDAESGQSLRIQKSEIEQAKFFEPEKALETVTDYLKPVIKKAIKQLKESMDSIDILIDGVLTVGSTPSIGQSKFVRNIRTSKKRPFSTHSDCLFYSDKIPNNVKVNIRDIEGWCTRFKEKVTTFDKATRNGNPCPAFKPRRRQ